MNTILLRSCLITALALLSGCHSAAPAPTLDKDPVGYFRSIESSQTPKAKAMRQEIADGPAALARERIAAQKEGIAVFPAQLNQPLPPDDQNAAPLYLKAAALRKGKVMLPIYAETLSARYSYTPKQLDRIQKIYDDNPDVFALLRQATDRPQCVFAKDWTKDTLQFPVWQNLRETARELKTESVLQAEGGHYGDAVSTEMRVYRVAEHTASEPTLLAYLTGVAIDSIATGGMQDILTLAGPNVDADVQVRQAVTDKPPHLSLRRALSGEVALTDANFSSLRHSGPIALSNLLNGSNDMAAAPSPAAEFTPQQRVLCANLLDAAEADYIHKLRAILRAVETPDQAAAFAWASKEATDEAGDPIKNLANTFLGFQPDADYGSLATMLTVYPLRSATSRAVTRAAATVLAERAKTGAYPAVLPGTFPDPFTGKPLGYRREGDGGFVIYSAGPDGKYDGGEPGDKAPLGMAQYRFRYPTVTVPVTKDRER